MPEFKKKILVISAPNLIEGGTLKVLQDSVASASKFFDANWLIYVIINNKDLINKDNRTILLEHSWPKKYWILRLLYEWIICYIISLRLKPDLWLSLHDITSNVLARRRVVYCHNPSMFYRATINDFIMDPKFYLFTKFYKFLYAINIKKNNYVVVQQQWIRENFRKIFNIDNVIVSYPEIKNEKYKGNVESNSRDIVFFYPSIPRPYKNFEIICDAVSILNSLTNNNYLVILTISGLENSYSKYIYKKYSGIKNIKFIGVQNRSNIESLYKESSAIIFPSKLETWGLPISEAKEHQKPLLLIDLPYAHESLGEYGNAVFFKNNDSNDLAIKMLSLITGKWSPNDHVFQSPESPHSKDWDELWRLLAYGL
jgi:glycosyltransferase involved in cell wall biosynthesis